MGSPLDSPYLPGHPRFFSLKRQGAPSFLRELLNFPWGAAKPKPPAEESSAQRVPHFLASFRWSVKQRMGRLEGEMPRHPRFFSLKRQGAPPFNGEVLFYG
jgi:hypothetical protein